jgi:hypothetical protein
MSLGDGCGAFGVAAGTCGVFVCQQCSDAVMQRLLALAAELYGLETGVGPFRGASGTCSAFYANSAVMQLCSDAMLLALSASVA